MLQPMPPEIEREYQRILEEAEGHFGAIVRWSKTAQEAQGDTTTYRPLSFEERWLLDLELLRKREALERKAYRTARA